MTPIGACEKGHDSLTPLYVVAGVVGLLLGIFSPLASTLLEQAGVDAVWVGANATTHFLFLAVGAPIVAVLARYLNLRDIIVLGLVGSALLAPVFAWVQGLPAWFAVRAGLGFSLALVMVGSQTGLNQWCPAERRSTASGLYGLCFGIGLGIGPVVGAQLYQLSPRWAFAVAGAIAFVAIAVVMLGVSGIGSAQERRFGRMPWGRIALPLQAVFAYGFVEATVVSLFPVYLLRHGADVNQVGWAFSGFVIGGLAATLPLARAADRFGRERVLAVIVIVGIAAVLALVQFESFVWILVASSIAGAALGPVYVITLSMLGARLPPNALMAGTSLFGMAFGLGATAGPFTSSIAMDQWGTVHLFTISAALFGLVWLQLFRRHSRSEPNRVVAACTEAEQGHVTSRVPTESRECVPAPDRVSRNMRRLLMSEQQPQAPSRRRFVKDTAAAGGLLLLGGGAATTLYDPPADLTSSAYRLWARHEPGDFSDAEFLVLCAVLAPSPHNTQPWRFAIHDDRIDVYADWTRSLGSADAQGRQLLLAMGCAIENMSVAAQHLGYAEAHIEIAAAGPIRSTGHCATVILGSRSSADSHALFPALFERRTTRAEFSPAPVVDELLRPMSLAGGHPELGLAWFRETEARNRISEHTRQAVREFLSSDARHRDGMAWFRTSRAQWQEAGDGISLYTGDAPTVVKNYVAWFADPDDLLSDSFKQGEIDHVDRLSRATPVWGLIYARSTSDSLRIAAGRWAEQVYLLAAASNLAIHPVSYTTEMPNTAAALVERLALPESAEPLFLFRLGHGPAMEQSVRRPLAQFIAPSQA